MAGGRFMVVHTCLSLGAEQQAISEGRVMVLFPANATT